MYAANPAADVAEPAPLPPDRSASRCSPGMRWEGRQQPIQVNVDLPAVRATLVSPPLRGRRGVLAAAGEAPPQPYARTNRNLEHLYQALSRPGAGLVLRACWLGLSRQARPGQPLRSSRHWRLSLRRFSAVTRPRVSGRVGFRRI